MGTATTPEERHLGEQEARLAGLAERLAEREAELAEGEAAYGRFVGLVGRRLSDLLAERARLDHEIATLLAKRMPEDPDLRKWQDLKEREAAEMAGTSRALAADGDAPWDGASYAEAEAERREKTPACGRCFARRPRGSTPISPRTTATARGARS